MILEVRSWHRVLIIQSRLPCAGVPSPANTLGAQQIADCLRVLWDQRGRRARIGVARITSTRGFVGARLIWRLQRVDGVEVRRQSAIADEPWNPFHCRSRRIRGELQGDAVGLDFADLGFGWTLISVGIVRRTSADKLEMVQKPT